MRRYDIVSGILLILSIIDFALAAPVLVQEKRQASVDVVHIPKDVITVLGKRGSEEVEKLLEEYFKAMGKPAESSDSHASSSSSPSGPDHGSTDVVQAPVPEPALSGAHASSSSAPLGPDHGPTNVVQAPPPNPASSTADPNLLKEPSSSSSTWPEPLSDSDLEQYESWYEPDEVLGAHAPQPNPDKRPLTDPDPDFDWDYWTDLVDPRPSGSAPPKRPHVSTNVVQAPAPNPASSTANPDPLMEPSGPSSTVPMQGDDGVHEPLQALASTGHDSDHELTGAHAPQPNPNKRPLTDPDPDFDWDYWTNLVNPRPSGSAPPKRPHVVQAPAPNPASSTANPDSLKEPSGPLSTVLMQGDDDGMHELLHALVSAKDSDPELTGAHAPQPNPSKMPLTDPDPDFDWNYWMHLEDWPSGSAPPKRTKLLSQIYEQVAQTWAQKPVPGPPTDPDLERIGSHGLPPLRLASPNEFGLAHHYQVEHVQQSDAGPSTTGPEHGVATSPLPNLGSPKDAEESKPEDGEVVARPPSNPGFELHSDDQSSSADSDSQSERDRLAALYAAKGKAKESRRVSGTARDVGNAVQRELQSTERSLYPGDLMVRNPGNF